MIPTDTSTTAGKTIHRPTLQLSATRHTSGTPTASPLGSSGSEHGLLQDFRTSHLPWTLHVDSPSTIMTSQVSLRADTGGPWFVDCQVDRMVGHRGRRQIDETAEQYVAMLIVRGGTEVFSQRGLQARVGPGQAALWDSSQPAECYSAAALTKQTLFLPRAAVAPAFQSLLRDGPKTIDPSPSLQLLTSWMETTRGHTQDRTTAARAGFLLLDLAHAVLASVCGERSGSRDVLLLQVKSYLDEQLHDSTLSLDGAAKACAISLRYLHMLFQETSETAAEYLRRRRLERARHLLTTTSSPSVAQVSDACGFSSPSTFSRAFRAEYGAPPSEVIPAALEWDESSKTNTRGGTSVRQA